MGASGSQDDEAEIGKLEEQVSKLRMVMLKLIYCCYFYPEKYYCCPLVNYFHSFISFEIDAECS